MEMELGTGLSPSCQAERSRSRRIVSVFTLSSNTMIAWICLAGMFGNRVTKVGNTVTQVGNSETKVGNRVT